MQRVAFGFMLMLALLAGCQSNSSKSHGGGAPPPPPGTPELLQGPLITVRGEVRQPLVPWTEGIRLSDALAQAGYLGSSDPFWISVIRQGRQVNRVSPRRLLSGAEDPLLLPNDVVEIRR